MADISKITLPNNSEYDIKDATAREKLEILDNAVENHGIGYIEETNVIVPETVIKPSNWYDGECWVQMDTNGFSAGTTYSITFGNTTYQSTAVSVEGWDDVPFESATIASTQTCTEDATLGDYMDAYAYVIPNFDKQAFANCAIVKVTVDGVDSYGYVYADSGDFIVGEAAGWAVGYYADGTQAAIDTGGVAMLCLYDNPPSSTISISVTGYLGILGSEDGYCVVRYAPYYYGTPPQNNITFKLELTNATIDIVRQIAPQMITYGEDLENAIKFNGMGRFGLPRVLIDTSTPAASGWIDDDEGGWYCEFTNLPAYSFSQNVFVVIEYGDSIWKGFNSRIDSSLGMNPECVSSSDGGVMNCFMYYNQDGSRATFDIYGELPQTEQHFKLTVYQSTYTIDEKFLPVTVTPKQKCWYGYCTTSSSTAVKTVSISDFPTSLTTGLSVRIRFAYGNTSSGTASLKINSLNAVNMYWYRGGSQSSSISAMAWVAGEVVDFVYDGTYFVMVNGGFASTTSYGVTKLSASTSSNSDATAATSSAVKAAYDLANGKQAAITANGILKGNGAGSITAATTSAVGTLSIDSAPTEDSDNLVTSGGVYTAIQSAGGGGLPSQSGNSGKFLTTDGSDPSWADVPKEVFVAECGTTTFSDILAAVNAGKVCFATIADLSLILVEIQYQDVSPFDPDMFVFSRATAASNGNSVGVSVVTCDSSDVWDWGSANSYTLPSQTNKAGKFLATNGTNESWTDLPIVTSVSSSSTDAQIPSAKLLNDTIDEVYEVINEITTYKDSVTTTTTWAGNGPYTQIVTLSSYTPTAYSKVDIQPDATAITQLLTDGVSALYISNTNGTLTMYAVGAAPTTALTLQVTVVETSEPLV